MNKVLIILGLITLPLIIFQAWTMYISKVEEQHFETVGTIGEVEFRHYPPAKMASVDMNPGISNPRNTGFRVLAGYIFGGNESNEKFAMTAPVHMAKNDSVARMSFVLPEASWKSELPVPNNSKVQIHWSSDQYVAAIKFGGYSSEEVYTKHKDKLLVTLKEKGVKHLNDFRLLGYDPPFKVVGRRNELIVSIDPTTLP